MGDGADPTNVKIGGKARSEHMHSTGRFCWDEMFFQKDFLLLSVPCSDSSLVGEQIGWAIEVMQLQFQQSNPRTPPVVTGTAEEVVRRSSGLLSVNARFQVILAIRR